MPSSLQRSAIAALAPGGQHDGHQAGQIGRLLNLFHQHESVHVGHVAVRHQQAERRSRGLGLAKQLERGRGVRYRGGPHAPVAERPLQNLAIRRVVVHHQHAHVVENLRTFQRGPRNRVLHRPEASREVESRSLALLRYPARSGRPSSRSSAWKWKARVRFRHSAAWWMYRPG